MASLCKCWALLFILRGFSIKTRRPISTKFKSRSTTKLGGLFKSRSTQKAQPQGPIWDHQISAEPRTSPGSMHDTIFRRVLPRTRGRLRSPNSELGTRNSPHNNPPGHMGLVLASTEPGWLFRKPSPGLCSTLREKRGGGSHRDPPT